MDNWLVKATELDKADKLSGFREKFHIPFQKDGNPFIYLCGNSLGLQPKATEAFVRQELLDWAALGVEGHFHAKNPWMPYHEFLTETTAEIVGALPHEVVNMNSLTVNLHLMMVSFYRPAGKKNKIVMESGAFPSDIYAIKSQLNYHGIDPSAGLIEWKPRDGERLHRMEDLREIIKSNAGEIALILIGGVNYLTGQVFDMAEITQLGHANDITVGFDLAHGAGNLHLKLHESGCDFAVWCSYKYLNSGPGSLAGCFVHERHADNRSLPRFAGWWGHDKETRFRMGPDFQPIYGAEGWQMSNPPILPMAAMRASFEIFVEAGMENLRHKSVALTGFLLDMLEEIDSDKIEVISPKLAQDRGAQVSISVKNADKGIFQKLIDNGVIADWREPDIIRIAPAPLYNTFEDAFNFVRVLNKII